MSYQKVPPITLHEEEQQRMTGEPVASPAASWSMRSKLGLAIFGVLGMASAVLYGANRTSAAAAGASNLAPLGSTNTVTPCTFEECSGSNCDYELAPYTCVFHNGGVHGGCSDAPWVEGSCTHQCDLSGCESLDIPHDTEDCKTKCDKKWCAMGRLCGPEVQYQCTGGASTFGCSSDEYQWTYKSLSTSCSSCCDVTTCE
jgi:hypothetical protein